MYFPPVSRRFSFFLHLSLPRPGLFFSTSTPPFFKLPPLFFTPLQQAFGNIELPFDTTIDTRSGSHHRRASVPSRPSFSLAVGLVLFVNTRSFTTLRSHALPLLPLHQLLLLLSLDLALLFGGPSSLSFVQLPFSPRLFLSPHERSGWSEFQRATVSFCPLGCRLVLASVPPSPRVSLVLPLCQRVGWNLGQW